MNMNCRTMKRLQIIISTLLFASVGLSAQAYTISVDAPDYPGKQVILAEYFTSRMVPKDTLDLNLYGSGTFSGEEAFDGGLYILYFDQGHYFDFMIGDDQDFKILVDTTDLVRNTQFIGSENNRIFFEYKIFLEDKRIEQQEYAEEMANADSKSDSARVRKKMDKLNEEMASYIDSIIDTNPGLFVSTFLKAMKDVAVPDEILVGSDREKDSIRYTYYKDHYFDHFDVSDVRLLHTPIYEPKIKTYINRVAVQHPDSLIRSVDKLIELSRSDDALFRYMLITLFNNFAESKMMGMDKVYFHIAEKYYIPEAVWSSEDFINELKENFEKSRHTFIGNPAPNFVLKQLPTEHFYLAQMDTAIKRDPHIGNDFLLYEVDAEYTLLYYWEADCGHCKKSTPALYEVFEKYRDQGVQVVSVHVINSVEGKEKWIDFVNEYGTYDWINCWSPYNNDFRNLYNLLSFPQLFLLDKDKTIKAKNISAEQADDILDNFLNQ